MNEIEQKEIEEMTKDFKCCVGCEMFGGYVDDNGELKEAHCIDRSADYCEKCYISTTQAKILHNAGYRNVKDKIVLSKEEYVDLTLAKQSIFKMLDEREDKLRKEFDETCEKCHWITDYNILKIHENEVIKLCEQEVKQARKETAREIIDKIDDMIGGKLIAQALREIYLGEE